MVPYQHLEEEVTYQHLEEVVTYQHLEEEAPYLLRTMEQWHQEVVVLYLQEVVPFPQVVVVVEGVG